MKALTLIIWGVNDQSSPMKLGIDLLQVIGSVVPRTEFHAFNHAGHYVFREHAQQVNQLITNFVMKLKLHKRAGNGAIDRTHTSTARRNESSWRNHLFHSLVSAESVEILCYFCRFHVTG